MLTSLISVQTIFLLTVRTATCLLWYQTLGSHTQMSRVFLVPNSGKPYPNVRCLPGIKLWEAIPKCHVSSWYQTLGSHTQMSCVFLVSNSGKPYPNVTCLPVTKLWEAIPKCHVSSWYQTLGSHTQMSRVFLVPNSGKPYPNVTLSRVFLVPNSGKPFPNHSKGMSPYKSRGSFRGGAFAPPSHILCMQH